MLTKEYLDALEAQTRSVIGVSPAVGGDDKDSSANGGSGQSGGGGEDRGED